MTTVLPYQELEPRLNDTKLNVTIVSECSGSHASGVNTSVENFTNYLASNGHTVTVVAPGPESDGYKNANQVITTPHVKIAGFPTARATSAKKFIDIYEQTQPNVVHLASPMGMPGGRLFLGGNGIIAAKKLGIPSVAIYQTDPVKYVSMLFSKHMTGPIKWQMRQMHNNVDVNLAPSKPAKDDLIDWGIKPDTIDILGRGVDTKLFNPERKQTESVQNLRRKWAKDGEVIIGVVSRLEPEKTLERLAVLKDIPNVKIIIIGKGSQRELLEKKLKDDNVAFMGELRGEELADAYAAFDLFAFPSTTETFGQVLQEAQSSGLPVVAANIGGPLDVIEDGVSGFLFEGLSDADFREKVENVVADENVRTVIGRQARERVESRSWNTFGDQLLNFYHQAIHNHRQRNALDQILRAQQAIHS